MPISSIITQPLALSLNAAYRPIIFLVRATATDSSAVPPVVYCDVYVNGVFYKTISKTQYSVNNTTNTDWQFDIQDAAQEVLTKYIATNGAGAIITTTGLQAFVFCKFRSSGYDSNGFIQAEDTAPVQATGTIAAVAGTGLQSNTFFALNTTLQHIDSQALANHLTYYRTGTWEANTFPLSHRTKNYKVCAKGSDFFGIFSASKHPNCLRLHYRNKGATTYNLLTSCAAITCAAVTAPSYSFPNAMVGTPYDYSVTVGGDAPFDLSTWTKPAWMSITINSSTGVVRFFGTPTTAGTNVTVSATVRNCQGVNSVVITDTIDIAGCSAPATITGDTMLDALQDTPYNFSVTIAGTTPLTLGAITKPTWMSVDQNVIVAGSTTLHFSGTPTSSDIGTGIAVTVAYTNTCGSGSYSGTLAVLKAYGCGDTFSSSNTSQDLSNTGYFVYDRCYLGVSGSIVHINWQSFDRPNRFTIYDSGVVVQTTGWVGFASYPGQWGPGNLATAESGSMTFTAEAGHIYYVLVEAGSANPTSPSSDNFFITITCG